MGTDYLYIAENAHTLESRHLIQAVFRRILGGVDPAEGGGGGAGGDERSLGTGFGDACRPTVPAPATVTAWAEVTGGVAESALLGRAMGWMDRGGNEVVSNRQETFRNYPSQSKGDGMIRQYKERGTRREVTGINTKLTDLGESRAKQRELGGWTETGCYLGIADSATAKYNCSYLPAYLYLYLYMVQVSARAAAGSS